MRRELIGICFVLLVFTALSCTKVESEAQQAWGSYLTGNPEIPCAQDSDCAVGACALDGCNSLVRTLRSGARIQMLKKIESLRVRCGESCAGEFQKELEEVFSDVESENSTALLRLAEALSLHSDPLRAQALVREKISQVTDPEVAYALQLELANLGDLDSRRELAASFPTRDATLDLMLLSSGVASEVGREKLCSVIDDGGLDSSLRALALVELCRIGKPCGQEVDSDADVRLLNGCAGLPQSGPSEL